MKKLDLFAILFLLAINFLLGRILYQYDFFVSEFTIKGIHKIIEILNIYATSVILTAIVFPKWQSYLHRRQIRIEIGDIEIAPFLNYHPEDVKNHEI